MAIPFPIIITERLTLREILLSDIDRIHFFRTDKAINKFIKRDPQTREMTIAFIEKVTANMRNNKCYNWGISTKESNELIGTICLWNFSEDKKTAEVGYDLDPQFHGKGIMSEALKAVLNFALTRGGFKIVQAYTDYRNFPSKKLLKQHGFIPNPNIQDSDNQNNEVFYLKF
ncbi:MAG: GNAT family N-acetyltransferase [Aequorivita sp.]|nr:GNAT family N-acetyltransferase [Aequorivita sp.]|tara:strand:+ start:99896 stop:100411 length:516 start_codon:yes stop_codon:yes gene_type:complete